MNNKPSVLIVDDEFSIRESFGLILSDKYVVAQAATGEGAIGIISERPFDLVYLDIRMPGMDGIETLRRIKEISPFTQVIMVTAVNDVQKASEAIKYGALDYIVKPFDVEKILSLTKNIISRRGLEKTASEISREDAGKLIGSSQKILDILSRAQGISTSENVLIEGEAGVEKAWLAQYINQLSSPANKFTVIDARGKTESELERKIFGVKLGASTVDIVNKAGSVGQGDTLFIDNAEELPFHIQDKLENVPARIILGSTAKFDLEKFNKTLYSKASKNIFILPPLRERTSDIPQLLAYFIEKKSETGNTKIKDASAEAKEILSAYSWPGNMLEMESLIERLSLIIGSPIIEISDLPIDIILRAAGSNVLPLDDLYAKYEKNYIKETIKLNSGNIERSAKMLEIQPQVLQSKI